METDRLLANQASPLADYTAARVYSQHSASASPNQHRSYCDSEGNKHISQRCPTPFTNGHSQPSPAPGKEHNWHHNGRVMDSKVDAPSPYVAVEKTQQRPTACLSVVGLTYTVQDNPGHWWNGNLFCKARPKQVLHNLTMTFNRGELTALIGASGSGKTSLLDVISGRAEGQVDGVVSYKHDQCSGHLMRHKVSYVLQADRLLPTLTVRETLTYMALMKLPGSLSSEHIEKKVQGVIEDMGLRHVADSRIGGAMIRGVSGGEKRRITIGVQLLKDPEILLLDEPTSGLDSFTARHLVSTLASIAHNGDKLVLMSVHQPRSDIVNMLDRIGILTSGQLAYLGPPSEIVPYFTSIGHPCPLNENPCDFYMDITSVDRRTPSSERTSLRNAQMFCNAFSKSQLQEVMIDTITSGLNYHYEDDEDHRPSQQSQSPSWFRICHCLLERMNVHLWRDRANLVGRLFQLPFFVPFMILYIGRLDLTMASIQDRMGLIYQGTQAPPYIGLTNALACFPVLRGLYYRESQDGMYSTSTFLSVFFLHILPFNILSGIFFAVFLYWVAGFNDDLLAFGQFVLVIIVLTQFGEMMAVAVMGVFRTSQLSSDTTSLVFSASGFLATGLIRSVATQPKVLQWIGYIAIHKYTTEIVIGNEFHGLEFGCNSEGSCAQRGDNFLDTYYPGALAHISRNFSLLGGFSIGILIFAVIMFKLRGSPTLH